MDSGPLSFSRKALVPSLDLSAFRAALDCRGAGNDPFLETTDGSTGVDDVFGEKEPPLQFLYSLNGILIAHVYYNFPIAAKLIGDQWSRLSEDFERAARSLGAGGLNRFFGLTLPMLRPSLVSAFILIFLLCLNSFPIILVLGGGIHHTTIEVQIYQLARIELDLEGAAVLALLQALISISILALLIRTRSALGRPKKIYQRSLLVEMSQARAPAWISASF